jgi:hypothetical protein
MFGGVTSAKKAGITELERVSQQQEKTENINENKLIDIIIKIKNIIKPLTLNTQDGQKGLQNFTIYLNTIYNCIMKPNCTFTMLLDSNKNDEINAYINEIRTLKDKMDCIQCNYWLQNAFIKNPYAYVNNLNHK